ncbi:hypothetical protein TRAPUB_12699, partial [Trametes pubescens]
SAQKLASACTRQRCKKHCLGHPTPCGFRAHDQERKALAAHPIPPPTDIFSLSHPEPATPSIPAPVGIGAPGNPQPGGTGPVDIARVHRAVMPDELKADWDAAMKRQLQKNRAEAERRENMIMDGSVSTQIQVQGPPSWPTIELAKLSHVIQDLGLHDQRAVQRFNLATRTWINLQLDYKIKVHSQEHILIRRIGVVDCIDLDDVCLRATGIRGRLNGLGNPQRMVAPLASPAYLPVPSYYPPHLGTPVPYAGTISPTWLDPRLATQVTLTQRPSMTTAPTLVSTDSLMSLVTSATSAMSLGSDGLASSHSAQSMMSTHFGDLGDSEVPDFAPGTPAPTPPPTARALPYGAQCATMPVPTIIPPPPLFHVYPMNAIAAAPAPTERHLARAKTQRPDLPKLSLDNLDQHWDKSLVYAPRTTRAWPAGFYARDVAKAFMFIGDDNDDVSGEDPEQKATLAERFEYVFGRPFKSTTYQRSRRAWVNSPQAQREKIADMPRTKDATWTQARKRLDGWRMENGHKRGQGKHAGEDEELE